MVNHTKIDTPKPGETQQSQGAVPRTSKRWYEKKPVIITLLILFFPIGLPLMWKFSPWAKRTKWLVSGVIAVLVASAFIATYNSTPTISINNASNGVINSDDVEYELTGSVTSYKETTLKINEVNVPLDVYNFSHTVSLEEGDNTFTLIAVSENGKATKKITIHRTTKEEFAARAKTDRAIAEAKKPKHTYDEFFEWITTYMRRPDGSGHTRWADINIQCDTWKDLDGDGSTDQYFNQSCLQDKYKDYIKPSAFEYGSSLDNGSGQLCQNKQEYQYLCSRFFDMETHIRAQHSGAYGVNVDEEKEKAKTIFHEIAITSSGN